MDEYVNDDGVWVSNISQEDLDHLQFEKLEWEDEANRLEEELDQTNQWLDQQSNKAEEWRIKYRSLKAQMENTIKKENETLYYKVSNYADVILEYDKLFLLISNGLPLKSISRDKINQLRKQGGFPEI
jgi:hypothetical protein